MDNSKTILVVDDEVIIAMATGEKLRNFGYQIELAHRADDAFNLATRSKKIDLILMDINLNNGESGPELARKILKERQLPIIFYTSYIDRETVHRVKGISRYGYVIKSCGDYVLQDAIETAFELFESDRKLRAVNRELQNKNKQLKMLENRFEILFETAGDAIFLHDIDSGLPGRIIEANKRAQEILQYSRSELLEMTVMDIVPQEEHKNIPGQLEKIITRGRATFESKQVKKDGTVVPVEVTAQVIGFEDKQFILAVVRDITDRKILEERLKLMASHDTLTGLFNRSAISDQLSPEIKRATRFKRPLSILMLDIDRFKQVNDNHGHQEGDRVLTRIGKIICSELRECDIPIRYGGEEFCIVLPETDLDGAYDAGERIRRKMANYRFTDPIGKDYTLTCSIGCAQHNGSETSDQLLKKADDALYHAKNSGRNQTERRQFKRCSEKSRPIVFEKGSDKINAKLLDHSKQGLKVATDRPLTGGTRITVDFGNHKKRGVVRWISNSGGKQKYKAGVKLDNPTELPEK